MKPPPPADIPDIIAPPPLLLLATLVLGIGGHALAGDTLPPLPIFRLAGMALGGLATALIAAAILTLRAAHTSVLPTRPTTALVAAGPYLISRNPIYLGMVLGVVALGLFLRSWIVLLAAAPLAAALHAGVILREEACLGRKFGAAYDEYRSRVRRWI